MATFRRLMVGLMIFNALVSVPEAVKIGGLPPALTVDEWIKGEPFSSFERGAVYLVEFWGTWCSPCIKNIPRLSDLQKRHASRGLVVLGVASHEFKGRVALMDFMKEKGGSMEYRVAFDADQTMERDWDTEGKEGTTFRLPLSFIIDRAGRIAFIGHPEDPGMEAAIDKAIAE